jgi:hypothetical protein
MLDPGLTTVLTYPVFSYRCLFLSQRVTSQPQAIGNRMAALPPPPPPGAPAANDADKSALRLLLNANLAALRKRANSIEQ